MKLASGHELGDVGQWWNCTHIPSAQYCFISTNAPNCALSIPQCNIGLCLPSACSVSDVESIAKQVNFPFLQNKRTIRRTNKQLKEKNYKNIIIIKIIINNKYENKFNSLNNY